MIAAQFPDDYNRYFEPFVGTGAVLATLAPKTAVAGDTLKSLIQFWTTLQTNPQSLIEYYAETIERFNLDRKSVYEEVKQRYNSRANPFDLTILSRTCYGGVMRFTREGLISTPIGPHTPIRPETFAVRVQEWRDRVKDTRFIHSSFVVSMEEPREGDIVYCDPPYVDTQSILYGAQDFNFSILIEMIAKCKERGAKVALSIDGKKKSGSKTIKLDIPKGLFNRELFLNCGSSMLRRFQNGGSPMKGEDVHDRLLLTW